MPWMILLLKLQELVMIIFEHEWDCLQVTMRTGPSLSPWTLAGSCCESSPRRCWSVSHRAPWPSTTRVTPTEHRQLQLLLPKKPLPSESWDHSSWHVRPLPYLVQISLRSSSISSHFWTPLRQKWQVDSIFSRLFCPWMVLWSMSFQQKGLRIYVKLGTSVSVAWA